MKKKSLTEKQQEINAEFASIFRRKRQMLVEMNLYSAKSYRFQVECEKLQAQIKELESKKKNLEQ